MSSTTSVTVEYYRSGRRRRPGVGIRVVQYPGPLCTNRFDAFAELDPAEFPDASNQLELLDRLFPRKTTAGAPKQRQRFVEWFPASLA